MIKITVTKGAVNEVRIEGHACYASAGKDIVCAGVSALYDALCCAAGKDPAYCEGKAHVCRFKGHSPELCMALTGFRRIEQRYGDYIRIRSEELGVNS